MYGCLFFTFTFLVCHVHFSSLDSYSQQLLYEQPTSRVTDSAYLDTKAKSFLIFLFYIHFSIFQALKGLSLMFQGRDIAESIWHFDILVVYIYIFQKFEAFRLRIFTENTMLIHITLVLHVSRLQVHRFTLVYHGFPRTKAGTYRQIL